MQKALDPQQKLRRKRHPVRRRGALICNQLQQKQQRNRRQHHPQKPQGKLPPQRKRAQTRFFPFHLFSPLFALPQRPGFRFACFFICDCLSFGQRCRFWHSGFLSPRRSTVLFRKEFAFFGFAPWRSSAFYFIVAGFCGKRYGELPAKIPKTPFFVCFTAVLCAKNDRFLHAPVSYCASFLQSARIRSFSVESARTVLLFKRYRMCYNGTIE